MEVVLVYELVEGVFSVVVDDVEGEGVVVVEELLLAVVVDRIHILLLGNKIIL